MADSHGHAPPPFCPNPDCDFHQDSKGWRYKKAGFYLRLQSPHRIQRYRCTHCRRAFSSQTFSTTYWLKRPDLQAPLLCGEVGGSGHRQQARTLRVAHSTVQRQIERLGRHCLLRHEQDRELARARLPSEPVVLDGLRSFAFGQYWPFEITSLVGARSYYAHDFTLTERRRSGQMTKAQRRRRRRYEQTLGRPDPRGLRKDTLELLRAVLPETGRIELRSDDEKAYPWALKRLRHPSLQHETIVSTAPRTPQNPLFAINAHHEFVRHSGANHKRETIAFSKRLAGAIWRHAIFQLWCNREKWASERKRGTTPAQRLGISRRRLEVEDLLGERLFPSRMPLRPRTRRYYEGGVRSRFLRQETVHDLKYAF